MRREQESARQFGIQRFATDLLDSIDNLDRALSAVPKESLTPSDSSTPNQDLTNLHGGLKMTEQIMMSALQKHGLERFDPLEGEGRKFDPNQDEATFFSKQEGKEDYQDPEDQQVSALLPLSQRLHMGRIAANYTWTKSPSDMCHVYSRNLHCFSRRPRDGLQRRRYQQSSHGAQVL